MGKKRNLCFSRAVTVTIIACYTKFRWIVVYNPCASRNESSTCVQSKTKYLNNDHAMMREDLRHSNMKGVNLMWSFPWGMKFQNFFDWEAQSLNIPLCTTNQIKIGSWKPVRYAKPPYIPTFLQWRNECYTYQQLESATHLFLCGLWSVGEVCFGMLGRYLNPLPMLLFGI